MDHQDAIHPLNGRKVRTWSTHAYYIDAFGFNVTEMSRMAQACLEQELTLRFRSTVANSAMVLLLRSHSTSMPRSQTAQSLLKPATYRLPPSSNFHPSQVKATSTDDASARWPHLDMHPPTISSFSSSPHQSLFAACAPSPQTRWQQ